MPDDSTLVCLGRCLAEAWGWGAVSGLVTACFAGSLAIASVAAGYLLAHWSRRWTRRP